MIKPRILSLVFCVMVGAVLAAIYCCRDTLNIFEHDSINDQDGNGQIRIAIANWGPHTSLDNAIAGIRTGLQELGLREGNEIIIDVAGANFDPVMIPQMIAALKANKPDLLVALSTPVAQVANNMAENIPVVFVAVTDPAAAGLNNDGNGRNGISGASDKQDVLLTLKFIKKVLPGATNLGFLYSTGEANDAALRNMVQQAARDLELKVIAVPIEQPRDIPVRMEAFRGKADFIYVGVSGVIQPSLPVIAAVADDMKIPVFNVESDAVEKNLVLGSFGVNYFNVGKNAARIIAVLLAEKVGANKSDISTSQLPIVLYPKSEEHFGYINSKRITGSLQIPHDLENVVIIQ